MISRDEFFSGDQVRFVMPEDYLIDQDTELGAKCWELAQKKALADYIEEKGRYENGKD